MFPFPKEYYDVKLCSGLFPFDKTLYTDIEDVLGKQLSNYFISLLETRISLFVYG